MTDVEKYKKYPYLVCGWLAPNGDFVECKHEEHRYIAKTLFKCDERDLEKKGYIKITFSMFNHQRKVIACKRPTQAQKEFLDLNEFSDDVDDIWIGGM
jgi:hypothetical protein